MPSCLPLSADAIKVESDDEKGAGVSSSTALVPSPHFARLAPQIRQVATKVGSAELPALSPPLQSSAFLLLFCCISPFASGKRAYCPPRCCRLHQNHKSTCGNIYLGFLGSYAIPANPNATNPLTWRIRARGTPPFRLQTGSRMVGARGPRHRRQSIDHQSASHLAISALLLACRALA